MACALLVALLLTPVGGCTGAGGRPNVLIVMVDTLRFDYLGYAGFDGDVSPAIDALARESVVFERCVAPAPWTAPSIASLFTSLHPQVHCMSYGDDRFCQREDRSRPETGFGTLPPDVTTLAEVFRDAGYDTAAFVGNWVVKSKFGFAQGFNVYGEPIGVETHVRSDRELFERAQAWLEGHTTGRPYLLYVHLMDTHAPYRVSRDDYRAVEDSASLGEDRAVTEAEAAARPSFVDARIQWSKLGAPSDRVRSWRAAYAAGVRALDRQIGEFLDGARRRGDLDRTVVVFTSDHGEEFVEHGGWTHSQSLFNELVRVPLVIRLPGGRRGGTRVERPVSLLDLMPTLIGLAGVREAPRDLQGEDLAPLWSAGEPSGPGLAYSTASPSMPNALSVQDASYKLVFDPFLEKVELYDLREDPGERVDRSQASRERTAEYLGYVREHLLRMSEIGSFRPMTSPLDEVDIERLRSLGYLQ